MNLLDFVKTKMKMSHIYQPVMIKALLENEGMLSIKAIAEQLLKYDQSQIEYYISVTKNMVGKVLERHEVVDREKDFYILKDFHTLTPEDIQSIISECEGKIEHYIKKRGLKIWEHRRKNRRPVPGSIRYEVLKGAKFRCELCGTSAEEKAIEVDHIVPKNYGGEDSIHNYQALCYTCNAQKRDTDSTDFREPEAFYHKKVQDCIFCYPSHKIQYENNLALAIFDLYPVTKHHLLVIPKRHAENYFELAQAEVNAINSILFKAKEELSNKDTSIGGFNIGINNGLVAGQTIFHCHVHLIPRRQGDVSNPSGGIRGIIPGKGSYLK